MEDKVPDSQLILISDHSGLVKFDSQNNPTYRNALENLKKFENEAQDIISGRLGNWYVDRRNLTYLNWKGAE